MKRTGRGTKHNWDCTLQRKRDARQGTDNIKTTCKHTLNYNNQLLLQEILVPNNVPLVPARAYMDFQIMVLWFQIEHTWISK